MSGNKTFAEVFDKVHKLVCELYRYPRAFVNHKTTEARVGFVMHARVHAH